MRRFALVLLVACDAEPVAEDPAVLAEAFRALHTPVYDAWTLPLDRDVLHDHLAATFSGEALTAEYVEHWRTRVRMERENTGIRVLGVEYEAVDVLDGGRVDATWLVRGVVSHQGHRHPRINRYRAVYTLAETPDGLRVVETRMRDLARVASDEPDDPFLGADPASGAAEGFLDPVEMFEGGLFGPEPAP